MLGFLLNIRADADADASGVSRSRCVPTAAFCLRHAETRSWRVLDARHGHVLLQQQPADPNCVDLLVWDLVTKEQRSPRSSGRCPARRRRHRGRLDCSAWLLRFSALSPLALATTLIATVDPSSWLLSSSMILKRWTATCAPTHPNLLHGAKESPLASSGQISRMELPTGCVRSKPRVFTTTEGGALGIATIRRDYKLYIWSREDTGYSSRWIQTRVIKLERLLPVDAFFGSAERPYVVGFAYRIGLLFFWANNVLYTVHVKTCEVKKLYKGHTIYNVVPYMSFYTPVLGAAFTGKGASAGG
ncbi:hypothetical protein PVAP13_9KG293500 [Panicum virgatum]|uniref:Uncharacterized protein n=1 Tax=Panicum virgatum TaxID=38727 RepID=A0A8T0NJJ3_PANVG|nr:hypothetical protein PVAP13_9KG293500 [Panicum virgatum]